MNIFTKAISDATFEIPPQILEKVFMTRRSWDYWRPVSLEQAILDAVVRPRVFVDLNLYGGRELIVPLRTVFKQRVTENCTVMKIPKNLTQNCSILTALNITFVDPARLTTYGTPTYGYESYMLTQAQGMVDAMSTIPSISSAYLQLIGENVLMVRDSAILPSEMFLRCRIANDENLSHVQMRSYPEVSLLVIYAIKAYIYNEYLIDMDAGEQRAGMVLGTFKNVIEGYADSNQNYRDHLRDTIQKVLFMNDNESYTRFIRLVNGGLR